MSSLLFVVTVASIAAIVVCFCLGLFAGHDRRHYWLAALGVAFALLFADITGDGRYFFGLSLAMVLGLLLGTVSGPKYLEEDELSNNN